MNGQGSRTQLIAHFAAPLRGRAGYTIIEVLIFLAVTGAIFVMIAGTFARRQAGTEFTVAAREMESQLQDLANDVSSGFYNNPGTFACQVIGGEPRLSPGTSQQGTNNDCIFIGRVAQFDVAGTNGRRYNAYTVVGARQASGEDVTDLTSAQPLAIASAPPRSTVDMVDSRLVPPGVTITSVYADNGTPQRVRGVGFFTSFGDVSADEPSSLSANVMPIGFPPVGNSTAGVVGAINSLNNASMANPSNGVIICMDGDNTDQHARLVVGGRERQLTTNLIIEEGTCASAGYPA